MKFVACAKVVEQLNDEKGHENYPADGNLIRSRHACAGGLDKIRRKKSTHRSQGLIESYQHPVPPQHGHQVVETGAHLYTGAGAARGHY